jgi:hypothetical protein
LKHVGTPVEGRLIEADVVRESGLLTEAELAITQNFTAVEILKKISSRGLTSLQVVEAFGKRAALAQQLVSCSSANFIRMSATDFCADIMLNRNLLCRSDGKSTNARQTLVRHWRSRRPTPWLTRQSEGTHLYTQRHEIKRS